MSAYYNEIDQRSAAWLRELIKAGLIADGEVDERSIVDVSGADLRGFAQCHFFAGIGGWSYALRLAGWSDSRSVWTGSCPCQPFSSAGSQVGGDDPRHLWPAWYRLIRECRPATVFGEQVEAAINHGWLDLVCDDLEREGYAVGAVGLPAACVGAPHFRQRVWFVADAGGERCDGQQLQLQPGQSRQANVEARRYGEVGNLAHAARGRLAVDRGAPWHAGHTDVREWVITVGDASGQGLQERERDGVIQRPTLDPSTWQTIERGSDTGELADAHSSVAGDRELQRSGRLVQPPENSALGFWANLDWLPCRDDKSRPVEPGTFPLAHGLPARVGRLRGYGNAIVPQVAAAFIKAYGVNG